MVEQDRYCIDVLTHIAAVTKALQQAGLGLFNDQMRHCVTDAVNPSPEQSNEKLAEVN